MSEVQKIWNSKRKYIINLILFVLSIVFIVWIISHDKNYTWPEMLGSSIAVTSCYIVLYLFLMQFRPEILKVTRKTFFIIITILFFVAITRICVSFNDQNVLYLIPFALIPIVIRTFYDSRLALYILLITIMLAGLIVPKPFELIFLNFLTGMVAIFSLSNTYRRGKLFLSCVFIVLCYSVIFFSINIENVEKIENIDWSNFKWIAGNGVMILLSYPLIFLFEKKFYFLSDTTLLELSDTNQPLLRKLAEEAPGSFQHSRQVAVLAEEAARAVNANVLLVRTGALYHDIGKIVNPECFVENQTLRASPHDNLDPVKSSKIIINHVNEGVLIARKYKLPVQIIDFIRTHHGTTKTYFFYRKYLETNQKTEETEKDFAYSGPKPFSKEMAIIMMADALEASSRTLDKHTEAFISELVERILLIQEQDDQFSDAPLTFKDITEIKSVFKKSLSTIYHSRVVYPE
ncbi:MAG: HDIG domain-containing protein [Bacteroidales bacterium]|nr:HDIG domain-containing protein [Bacteroidales bacterium]